MATARRKMLIELEIDQEVETRKAVLNMVSVLNQKHAHIFAYTPVKKPKELPEVSPPDQKNNHKKTAKRSDGYIWWLHSSEEKYKK